MGLAFPPSRWWSPAFLPVHKFWWKIKGNKTSALGAIIQLHECLTSASDYIWVRYDGRQQCPCHRKSQPKRQRATVTRLRGPLQPFVFLPLSLIGDFDFSIKVATVGNCGIMSPLNCNPMSVKMTLNISQHFIIFLPVFTPPFKVTMIKSFGASSFLRRRWWRCGTAAT